MGKDVPRHYIGKGGKIYTRAVHKTTIELDEDLVAQAAEALGTRGLKATVQRALEEAVARKLRVDFIQQLTDMDGLDLDDPEVIEQAWR